MFSAYVVVGEPPTDDASAVPMPSAEPQLRGDEDPLEPGDLDLGLAPPPERVEE